MKAKEIAEKLNLPLKSVETLILRVRRRSRSQDLDDLMDAAAIQPRSGAPQRAPPGSTLSHVVRAGVQEFEVQPMQQAANQAIQERVTLGQISPNRPLGNQQVYNILQDPSHCQQDPQEPRAITRKRQINRNAQNRGHLHQRFDYLGELEQLVDNQEALIICTDEKPYYFGGTTNHRASAPQGQPSYGHRNSRRFKIEQWAAACGDDCRFTRPWLGWDTKSPELTPQDAWDLSIANAKARAYTEYLQGQCTVTNTVENKVYIEALQQWELQYNWHLANRRAPPRRPEPADVYPPQEFIMNEDNKAMDYVFYAFRIYRDLPFPYWQTLKDANPGKMVVIQEDGASPH